jgi:hypothetical protein
VTTWTPCHPPSANPNDKAAIDAAVRRLELLFGLQIPRTADALTVKRLLTLAARVNYEKITPEISDTLKTVGAPVPVLENTGNLRCFGVVFQRNHSICLRCGLREACAVESANYGLSTITLSPKLVNAKGLVRVAAVNPLL